MEAVVLRARRGRLAEAAGIAALVHHVDAVVEQPGEQPGVGGLQEAVNQRPGPMVTCTPRWIRWAPPEDTTAAALPSPTSPLSVTPR